MKKQNYETHARYYIPHHFIFYPVILVLLGIACTLLIRDAPNRLLWAMLCSIIVLLGLFSLMTRQHYSIINQNRIIRLELRFRYYVLTQRRFEEVEARLSQGQINALRFAPDEEFQGLVERVLKENSSADEIKRSIKNWLPDTMRV